MTAIFVVLTLIVAHPFLTMLALLFTANRVQVSNERRRRERWAAEQPAKLAEERRQIQASMGIVDGR